MFVTISKEATLMIKEIRLSGVQKIRVCILKPPVNCMDLDTLSLSFLNWW